MISLVSSLAFDFHIPVDFGLNVLFPHIFSALHRYSIETCWFSLVMHESLLMEEISMQSSLNSRISMLLPPVLAQSAFALPKQNQDTLTQIRSFEFFGFRCVVTGPKGCAEAMWLSSIRPVRSDGFVRNLTHHFR
jgi:hypothetical protein